MFDKHGVFVYFLPYCAEVVELVDTRDLKSLGLIARTGSSPVLGIFLLDNGVFKSILLALPVELSLEGDGVSGGLRGIRLSRQFQIQAGAQALQGSQNQAIAHPIAGMLLYRQPSVSRQQSTE